MGKLVTDEDDAKATAFYETGLPPNVEVGYPHIASAIASVPMALSDKLYAATMYALINLNALACATEDEPRMHEKVRKVPLKEMAEVYRMMADIADRLREHVNAGGDT